MDILLMWLILIAGVVYVLAAVRNEDKRKQSQRNMENKLLSQAREIDEFRAKKENRDIN